MMNLLNFFARILRPFIMLLIAILAVEHIIVAGENVLLYALIKIVLFSAAALIVIFDFLVFGFRDIVS